MSDAGSRRAAEINRQMPPQPDLEIPPKVVEPIEQVFRIEGIEGKAMP